MVHFMITSSAEADLSFHLKEINRKKEIKKKKTTTTNHTKGKCLHFLPLKWNSLQWLDVFELPVQRMDFPWGIPSAHSEHNKRCYGEEGHSLNKPLQKPQLTRRQLEIVLATFSSTYVLIQSLSKVRGRAGGESPGTSWWKALLVLQAWEKPKLGPSAANDHLKTPSQSLHCFKTSPREIKSK